MRKMNMECLKQIDILLGVFFLIAAFLTGGIAEGHALSEADTETPTLTGQGLVGDCPAYRGRNYEMHYGFVNELLHTGSEEPIVVEVVLTPVYEGTQCSGQFCSALHLTSELLWEKGDPDSLPSPDYCISPGGSYHTSIRWKTQTGTAGDAWDGLSFVFGYPQRDTESAKLRIDILVTRANSGTEVYRSSETYTAKQLEQNFPQVFNPKGYKQPYSVKVTPEGHEVQLGSHFSLAYRVYDFLMIWGYGTFTHQEKDHVQTCENPSWPLDIGPIKNWKGRLKLSSGMIHPVKGRNFRQGEDTVTNCNGATLSAGQLVPELCFDSFVDEKVMRQRYSFEDNHVVENGNAKALTMNLVVPTEAFFKPDTWPVFSVHMAAEGQTLIDGSLSVEEYRDHETDESTGGAYPLPWRWQSIDAVFRCADTKHFVHAHEHW